MMSKRLRSKAILLALLSSPLLACSPPDECVAGDYDCLLDHVELYDQSGDRIELVDIDLTAAISDTIDNNGAPGGPTFSGYPSSYEFFDESSYVQLDLEFDDPTGTSAPGSCVCVHALKSSHYCSTRTRCSRSIPDGQKKGRSKTQLRINATSPTGDDFGVTHTPIAPTTPGTEATDGLKNGDPPLIGKPQDVPAKIDAKKNGSSSASTGTGACAGHNAVGACGASAGYPPCCSAADTCVIGVPSMIGTCQ
jgi:hypothetical protein